MAEKFEYEKTRTQSRKIIMICNKSVVISAAVNIYTDLF